MQMLPLQEQVSEGSSESCVLLPWDLLSGNEFMQLQVYVEVSECVDKDVHSECCVHVYSFNSKQLSQDIY